jgi:hypothetical protein
MARDQSGLSVVDVDALKGDTLLSERIAARYT